MTSDPVFVWTWLPGAEDPVVAGVIEARGDLMPFAYAASYRQRSDAISLYGPELPLRQGTLPPLGSLTLAGALRDGSPDAWGRSVISDRLGTDGAQLTELDYMLHSGSNRLGAIDFQASPTEYVPRESFASLAELQKASATLQEGTKLPAELEQALVRGTSIGGARPKATIVDEGVSYIAKFSSTSDTVFQVVNAEGTAMELARRAGIRTSDTSVITVDTKDVLLVRRFDREGRRRIHVVSALTMTGRSENDWTDRSTYPDLLDVLRQHGTLEFDPGRELFARIAFNMAISNSDDHARNHAAFWDGSQLTLTPAYDLAPGTRSGDTAVQNMAYGRSGEKNANFADLLQTREIYGLSTHQAREVIDNIVDIIRDDFDEAADLARVPGRDRHLLKNHLFLNRGLFYGYSRTVIAPGWETPPA
jgi:serine/threonine-protein kinase HipA